MLFLDGNVPFYCQRRIYQTKSYCSKLPQAPKNKMQGKMNGANLSQAMRFSRFVQNYSVSKGPPDDICVGKGGIVNLNFDPNKLLSKPDCNNPVFGRQWATKTNLPRCSCSQLSTVAQQFFI